jgi:hypothetical protein
LAQSTKTGTTQVAWLGLEIVSPWGPRVVGRATGNESTLVESTNLLLSLTKLKTAPCRRTWLAFGGTFAKHRCAVKSLSNFGSSIKLELQMNDNLKNFSRISWEIR